MNALQHPALGMLAAHLWMSCVVAAGEIRDTRWQHGRGAWSAAAQWTHGVPDEWSRVTMNGVSEARLDSDNPVFVGGLHMGTSAGDRARLIIAGGGLAARRDFINTGGHGDGESEIVIENGGLHCVAPIYLGGTGEKIASDCKARLTVRGGSVFCRILTLGWGHGAEAVLHVDGSRVEAVHVLDYLTMGVPGAEGAPSVSTLAFTLDERGVTPVTIQSRHTGLTISRKAANRCRLAVNLRAVPPREDVTLIAAPAKTQGEFDDLPEGAEVRASHGGREYAWTLTYRGGAGGCDVVLTKVRGHAADAPATPCRARPAVPTPFWENIASTEEPSAADAKPAFEAAEGFGRYAVGGRDGVQLWVENLNDDGRGSFRAAMNTKGARRIHFRVSGEIALKSVLRVSEPFVTVDGSTAPPGGITFTGDGFLVTTHDVVLRHFRIRPGDESDDTDALSFSDAQRCIVDHLSLGWGTDEVCSISGLSDEITVQWCLIHEGLNRTQHGYAAIAGGERVTWHHNLMAHHVSRVPRFAGITRCDFRNNVLYNWGHTAGYGQFERLNYVANHLKPGPDTKLRTHVIHTGTDVVGARSLFLEGNVIEHDEAATRDNRRAAPFEPAVFRMQPTSFPPVKTESATDAFESVLRHAGATPAMRDSTDARIVREVRAGGGRIIGKVRDLNE